MQNEKKSSIKKKTEEKKHLKAQKCCSECNCTGYDQDHDNICKCGHNSERHSC